MQKNKFNLLSFISKNREFYVGLIILILLSLAFIIYSLLSVNAGDAFVWSRYTHFGVTHFYRDKWYYSYSWSIFSVIVSVLHIILASQSLKRGKKQLAIFIVFSAVAVIIFTFTSFSRIIQLPR